MNTPCHEDSTSSNQLADDDAAWSNETDEGLIDDIRPKKMMRVLLSKCAYEASAGKDNEDLEILIRKARDPVWVMQGFNSETSRCRKSAFDFFRTALIALSAPVGTLFIAMSLYDTYNDSKPSSNTTLHSTVGRLGVLSVALKYDVAHFSSDIILTLRKAGSLKKNEEFSAADMIGAELDVLFVSKFDFPLALPTAVGMWVRATEHKLGMTIEVSDRRLVVWSSVLFYSITNGPTPKNMNTTILAGCVFMAELFNMYPHSRECCVHIANQDQDRRARARARVRHGMKTRSSIGFPIIQCLLCLMSNMSPGIDRRCIISTATWLHSISRATKANWWRCAMA